MANILIVEDEEVIHELIKRNLSLVGHICHSAFDGKEGETRTVDVHIQKLRKKTGWENRIKTVYKMGYRLEAGT